MDKAKRLAKQYSALWRDMPGAMTVLHTTIVGGTVCAVLMARDAVAGLVAFLVFLAVLLAMVPVCAQLDIRK